MPMDSCSKYKIVISKDALLDIKSIKKYIRWEASPASIGVE